MIRILHIGDIHFDKPFVGWKAQTGKKLRKGIIETFAIAVETAIHHEIDLIILAGDICDQETMMPQTAYYLSEALNKLIEANCQVLMITGNHDPWTGYAQLPYLRIPEGVMIAHSPQMMHWNCYSKKGIPYQIVACGHDEKGISDSVIQTFIQKQDLPKHPAVVTDEPCLVVGAAHAAIIGMRGEVEKGHMPYMPITIEKIDSLNYDYFALGHIHKPQQWNQGRIAYSGSLQGLSSDETGMHGGWFIQCEHTGLKHKFLQLSVYTFEKNDIACDGITTVEGLIRTIKESYEKQLMEKSNPPSTQLLTVNLTGRSQLKAWINQLDQCNWLEETLIDVLGALEVRINHNDLRMPIDLESYLHTDTFLGELLRKTDDLERVDSLLEQLEDPFLKTFNNDEAKKQFAIETLKQSKEQLIELFVGDANEN